MPRSIFLGRPWPTNGEPLFLEDDRAWAYALEDVENEMCPCGCGQPSAESTAYGAEDDYDVHVQTCHARAAIERRLEGSAIPGALVSVTRTRRSDAASSLPPSRDKRK